MCGFFSLSLMQMLALSIPLWGGHIGLSAALLGITVGARSVLPMVYSIHFGAMMDALGVRRILIVAASGCAALPLLHPLALAAPALIVLQLALGLASATVWLAAQTSVARLAAGAPQLPSRFSFVTVAGTVVGAPLLGLAWDFGGPMAGFALIALWGGGALAAALILPAERSRHSRTVSWRVLLPDLRAYGRAWRVLLMPAGALVISASSLRLAGISMKESFYPVLLANDGHTASVIGGLFALASLVSAPAALLAPQLTRLVGSESRALVGGVLFLLAAITITPALDGVVMLALAMAMFGAGIGATMPLMFSILAQDLPSDAQGVGAGLRATVNRAAAFVIPIMMGLISELAGVTLAFWVTGAALILAAATLGLIVRRRAGGAHSPGD